MPSPEQSAETARETSCVKSAQTERLTVSPIRWQDWEGFRRESLEANGGRYWDRTSGFHRVKVALYR